MLKLFNYRLNLDFLVNPFYLYCISFSLAIFMYLWGWSSIFPKLSGSLMLFFAVTFGLFIYIGNVYARQKVSTVRNDQLKPYLNDFIFAIIIFLGIVNVSFMGYLPMIDRSHNYREFGMPVIDPIFNTLSIFFTVFFFQSFLNTKKKRLLIYILLILVLQFLLFRRSTIVWIITSSAFLYITNKKTVKMYLIIVGIICLPLISYCFGAYGSIRNNLSPSYIFDKLGASETFRNSNINHNHYLSYLYMSSPLANLQKNINYRNEEAVKNDFKEFLFYCLIPESFTLRLQKTLNLSPPVCSLITPDLIVGTYLMVSVYTMGWTGMIIMFLFFFAFVVVCLALIRRWNSFDQVTFSLLSTSVTLLIFSNFLNRMDVILMLFVYPVFFHIVNSGLNKAKRVSSSL